MLKLGSLISELKRLKLSKAKAESGIDIPLPQYVKLNPSLTPRIAAEQIAECCGKEKARIAPGLSGGQHETSTR